MSSEGLAKWKEDFEELLNNLVKQMQSSTNKALKEQSYKQTQSNQNQFFQQNQMVLNNQDVFQMKFLDQNFQLFHFCFNQRYKSYCYPVKLIDSHFEEEIDQRQYINPIFEFKMSENNIVLTIKHQYKENLTRFEHSQDSIMIKEVFVGFKKDEFIYLFLIKNIGVCSQVEIHPLNNNYVVILSTTQAWNRQYQHQKNQYFFVYQIRNSRQPIMQLNLEKCMDNSATAFTFSQDEDENQFFLYFLSINGQIYYYNLILPEMMIGFQTKTYLQQNHPELVQFLEQKQEKIFKINYDSTTSIDYQRRGVKFEKFISANYSLPICQSANITKLFLKDYHLFFVICKLENGNIIIQGLIGQDLTKLFEIYQDEIIFQKSQNEQSFPKNSIHLNEPYILYNKNKIVHIAQNALDLPNRYLLLIRYLNHLITVDYSNIIQTRQDQSPINVSCIDLLSFEEKQKQPLQFIQQSLCLDLFKSKKILLQIINDKQEIIYKLLPSKLFVALVDPNQELNKLVLDFYQEKNRILILKKSLQQYKEKLFQIKNRKLQSCKSDDEIVQINEDLLDGFQASVKGAAAKIKLETENMFNDIETKSRNDLGSQVKRNLELQKKVSEKNERINQLLERLKQTPVTVIHQQLKNQQKMEDLSLFTAQFEKIQEDIRQQRRQLEDKISSSNRTKQEIDAIQFNLVQQIQNKKD